MQPSQLGADIAISDAAVPIDARGASAERYSRRRSARHRRQKRIVADDRVAVTLENDDTGRLRQSREAQPPKCCG